MFFSFRRKSAPPQPRLAADRFDEAEVIVRLALLGAELSQSMVFADEVRGRQALSSLKQLFGELKRQKVFEAAECKRQEMKVDAQTPVQTRFELDSLFLLRSFQHVCPLHGQGRHCTKRVSVGLKEEFHYATGLHIDAHVFAVCHVLPVSYSEQSVGGVRVADKSNILTLGSLDRLGLPLVAHFHSHPGVGPGSTNPSGTDHAFQERLERGGHVAIGGIWSQDGFVRFFAGDPSRFAIRVHGHQVKEVEPNVFKLEMADGDIPVAAS